MLRNKEIASLTFKVSLIWCHKSIYGKFILKHMKTFGGKVKNILNNFIYFLKLCSSSLLSARLKAFKMSLDQVPVVTTLLRASRDANELLLKECFQHILENKHGITSKELNATDKSGRVSKP